MQTRHHSLHLTLFFTAGVSLQTWDRTGMFEREVALYRSLQQQGVRVSFITYGNARDRDYAERLPGIRILCNRWRLPSVYYRRFIPLLHGFRLSTCTIIKTNQTNGADTALRAARLWRKPFIARCGYMWSDFVAREHGPDAPVTRQTRALEQKVFSAADRIIVTTPVMAADISGRIPQAQHRIAVIPNYVDTQLFRAGHGSQMRYDLVFIGRLEPQKNVAALLEAVRGLDVRLAVIGTGGQSSDLQSRYHDLREQVHWLGNVPHVQLPDYLRASALFILPSLYEGHPKTLIEAMACGMPVIGADAPGIREILRHGENGWLCGTDPASIRQAIVRLLEDAGLRERLGGRALQFALEHYALDTIVRRELQLYRSLCPTALQPGDPA